MMFQGAIAKFDPKTEQFNFYPMPKEQNDNVTQLNMLGLEHQVDGKIWTNNAGNQEIYRIDLASGKYETLAPMKQIATPGNHTIYGIDSDSKNNLWFMEFQDNYIGRIDAKTGALSLFRAPTERSRNRRGVMDDAGPAVVRGISRQQDRHVRHQASRPSRNGRCRRRGPAPTIRWSTRTAKSGPAA